MDKKVRVRFAPSPTGPLHIGGVRTALFNYLFARQNDGVMILRIEDTDSNRFVPGAEDYINEALQWLGIGIDEGVREGGNYGPYKQSERRDIYRKYVKQLLDDGKAYIAFDTPEELDAKRKEIANFQYDAKTRGMMRNSLTLSKEEVDRLIAAGEKYVVRILIEPNQEVKVNDLIRGEVTVNSSVVDDKVLYKSADDLPTYHLANIVDDHLMEVSHVIRGEEWLPSAPLHVLLYEAFGWKDSMPQFVHLPLLLKPDGKGKLSKRDGDRLGFPVFPLEWHDPVSGDISSGYRERGYLPQAVVNFLALLGWNPGTDQEIFSMDELIKQFSFDHCSKKGAKFDFENGVDASQFTDEYITRAVGMIKSRISFVGDIWDNAKFFFQTPTEYAPKDIKKRWKEDTPETMHRLIEVIKGIDDMTSANAEEIVLGWIKDNELHMGNVMNAFRLTVVGECKGPHMFDIAELMGKDEIIARIERGIENIKPVTE